MAKTKKQPKKSRKPLNKTKLRLVKKFDKHGKAVSRWVRTGEDHPADKAIDAAKEFEKNRRRIARKKYQERVNKHDPDAKMSYMYGMRAGRGIMVNEKTGIAYIHAKEGEKIHKVNINDLKHAIKGRRKSVGSLDEIFDRAPDDHIHHLLEQNEARSVKIEDTKVKRGNTMRSFKVVDSPQGPIITEGAFKGFFLDDMVTMKQRLRGGAGYVVDPATGKAMRRTTKQSGRRMVNVFHEVYMKKQGGKARIYVPHGDAYAIKLLKDAGCKREAAGGHIFTTPLSQVMGLTQVLGSFSMDKHVSKAITDSVNQRNSALLRGYMDESKERNEESASKIKSLGDKEYDGLRGYDIKGMNKEVGGKQFQLRYTQIQALRTMLADATGDSQKGSIIGLDTGLGKTLLAISFHLKMRELGAYKHKNNGKMCIVTINTNFNTYRKEIEAFVDPKVGGKFVQNPDGSISNNLFTIYPQSKFNARYVAEKGGGTPEEMQKYASIVCDEPQDWMKNSSTGAQQFFANLDHPQKHISSESVMTKRPKEISNYLNIVRNNNSEEDRKDYAKSFTAMFEGGAAAVPKEEYEDRVRTFIRDNVIYYHKTDEPTMVFRGGDTKYRFPGMRGEENGERVMQSVTVPPAVAAHYEKLAQPIMETLGRIHQKWSSIKSSDDMRDIEGQLAESLGSEKIGGIAVSHRIADMQSFLHMPENYIKGVKNPKIEHAVKDLQHHTANGRVPLAFAESPELNLKTAKRFSEAMGPNKLSICFTAPSGQKFANVEKSLDPQTKELSKHNSKITVWHNGEVIRSESVQKYMSDAGRDMSTVMKDMLDDIRKDPKIPKSKRAGLKWGSIHAGDSYNAGQNLQNDAHVVMHMDRDNSNTKVLYQRESRVMRPGGMPKEESEALAKHIGAPKGTMFSAVTRGTVHYYDVDNLPGQAKSTDVLEKLRGEHESKLFDRIVFQSNKAKIADAGVTSTTAKDISVKRRKQDRTLALAGLGSVKAQMVHGQDADAMIRDSIPA